jgi:hypothetical protein
MQSQAVMSIVRAGTAVALAALMTAGCSSFGGQKPVQVINANVYPANYRNQIAMLLRTLLTDRADFLGAYISAPALKSTGDAQHYVVCVQFNGHGQPKEKVAIYLAGEVTQFVDAKPQECADAVYQPFTELAGVMPRR